MATTKSKSFREKQSARSKKTLANPNIRARMSQRATISNIHNSEKISKSLKEYYQDEEVRQMLSDRTRACWQDEKYSEKVRAKLRERWEDPEYRGKVLGSRSRLKKRLVSIIRKLEVIGADYIPNFVLGLYTFDFKIGKNILFDEEATEEKQVFLSHYFPDIKYISDLAEVEKPEN